MRHFYQSLPSICGLLVLHRIYVPFTKTTIFSLTDLSLRLAKSHSILPVIFFTVARWDDSRVYFGRNYLLDSVRLCNSYLKRNSRYLATYSSSRHLWETGFLVVWQMTRTCVIRNRNMSWQNYWKNIILSCHVYVRQLYVKPRFGILSLKKRPSWFEEWSCDIGCTEKDWRLT